MNWKLILQLSLFGLAMALITVSIIPTKIEPVFWLLIFIACAYLIAKNTSGNYFLHGFLVSLVNCVWITTAHLVFFSTYMTHHPELAQMNTTMPMVDHPRLMVLITGPVIGAVSGLVLGFFSFIAGKLVKKTT